MKFVLKQSNKLLPVLQTSNFYLLGGFATVKKSKSAYVKLIISCISLNKDKYNVYYFCNHFRDGKNIIFPYLNSKYAIHWQTPKKI